ncbi:MAG: acetate--CoA ligase family protein [Pseudomonadota bacterium]|nr:acetate--CoA ligase family protein [Pseudomonadota bacterium]
MNQMTPAPKPDLRALFDPKSIAVIGASNDTAKIPGMTLESLLKHKTDASVPVYPVHPKLPEVQGLKAYPSVEAVVEATGAAPELAIIVIPAKAVPDMLEGCAQAGVRAAIIITSGFAEEQGEEGAALQARVQETIRRHGLAVLGPNAQGYANFARALCCTFSPAVRLATDPLIPEWCEDGGRISVVAQSGALGFSLYDTGRLKELPYRFVVTTGNEAGVSAFDVVDHLLDEGGTQVFVMFLEGIRDAARFRQVAERALREGKPLVVAKVGMSAAAERSAASHTGALAGSWRANKAMFDAYGVTLVESHEELIDVAAAFMVNRHRLPKGRGVGIPTSSGGAGGWTADGCAAAGLEVPELEPEARARIDEFLPPYGSSVNPVDGTAQAIGLIGNSELTRLTALSERVHGIVGVTSAINAAAFLKEGDNFPKVGRELEKPICYWSYTRPSRETFALFAKSGWALSTNVRHSTRAMAAMCAYAEAKARFRPPLVADAVPAEGEIETMTERDAKAWLHEAGVGGAPGGLATSAAEAASLAAALGRPAALKIQSPDIPHKTEAGGVSLGVAADAAADEYAALLARVKAHAPDARIEGVLVEPMAPGGTQMLLGVTRDPLFGPMLLVGAGGIYAEVLDDVALSPLVDDEDAALRLLKGLKTWPLLDGARGQARADVPALVKLMLALCRFVSDNAARIEEIDLNPVVAHEAGQGVSVLDALVLRRAG